MLADLHLHTTESDGTLTPKQVVWKASQHSLKLIAITDHDTTAGIAEAIENAPHNLEVVSGIELSAVAPSGEEVHIIGLWIDPLCVELQNQLTVFRQSRLRRTKKIVDRLNELGISLSYEDVIKFAHKDVLSRSHIASALLAKGIVKNKEEAFKTLVGEGAPAYVERYKIAPSEGVKLILKAGGVPVLAHPGLLNDLEILPSLVKAGLVGLEVVHSSHTPKQTKYFRELATEWHLLPSGGSDCHGPGGKDRVYLGEYTIPLSWVKDLKKQQLH